MARFDCNPTTRESLGLLVEEQRVNFTNYSDQFDNAYWTKAQTTIVPNVVIAPDGTLSGDLFYPTVSGSDSTNRILKAAAIGSGSFTSSIYLKYAGFQWVMISAPESSSGNFKSWFDIINGVAGTIGSSVVNSNIQSVGNGWYKISVTSTSVSSVNQYIYVAVVDANNSSTVTANGTNGAYIFGAQLEAGAFATSYIPTVASQVTRSADVSSMTGTNFSSWYSFIEGTLYAEAAQNATNSTLAEVASFDDTTVGGYNSRILLYLNNSARSIQLTTYDNAGNLVTDIKGNTPLLSQGVFKKAAFALKTDNFAQVSDGGSLNVDTAGAIATPNVLGIGFDIGFVNNYLNGTIKKIAYYPHRLTNAQLQGLTTV